MNQPQAKAKPEVAPEKPDAERKVQPILRTRMDPSEYKRTLYTVTAYENTEPTDLLNPEYWAHVASDLRAWDKIEARADNGSWYAEFIVLDCSRNWARVHLLTKHDLTTKDVSLSQASRDQYEVMHRGPERKWSVVRKSDRAVLKDELSAEAEAYTWLAQHIKA